MQCAEYPGSALKDIIDCAKGPEGNQILVKNGEISQKIHYKHVPYVLINGVPYDESDDFISAVCSGFSWAPPVCRQNQRQ